MDKENVVHLHNGVLLALKNNDIVEICRQMNFGTRKKKFRVRLPRLRKANVVCNHL